MESDSSKKIQFYYPRFIIINKYLCIFDNRFKEGSPYA